MSQRTDMEKKIVEKFKAAKLRMRFINTPVHGTVDIISFDVENRGKTGEQFRLYVPSDGNVSVVSVSQKHQQVVLEIEEEMTPFEDEIELNGTKTQKIKAIKKLVEEFGQENVDTDESGNPWVVFVERYTSGAKRYFLVGKDDEHYFIAQLKRKVTSVEGAHDALIPNEVRRFVKENPKLLVKRQGEFFLLPLLPNAKRKLEKWILDHPEEVVSMNCGAGNEGAELNYNIEDDENDSDHTAEYKVFFDDQYVRGAIKQERHKTKTLKDWHMVVRNNEEQQPDGVDWVD